MQYRRESDGLRAVAALPVRFFHALPDVARGGIPGVDVFFVISDYLIASIRMAEVERGRFSILGFYERRARRIQPALFEVMAASIPFAWMWMPPGPLGGFARSLIAAPLFGSIFLFWSQSGYFAQTGELKPLLHIWSLAVAQWGASRYPDANLFLAPGRARKLLASDYSRLSAPGAPLPARGAGPDPVRKWQPSSAL